MLIAAKEKRLYLYKSKNNGNYVVILCVLLLWHAFSYIRSCLDRIDCCCCCSKTKSD